MEELRMALDLLLSEGLSEIIISNPRQKEGTVKVKIRPVLLKEQLMFQVTRFRGKQVFHENLDREQAKEEIEALLTEDFRQLEGENRGKKLLVLVSKKGKMTVKWTGKQTKCSRQQQCRLFPITEKRNICWKRGYRFHFWLILVCRQ